MKKSTTKLTCKLEYIKYPESRTLSMKYLRCSNCKTIYSLSNTILNSKFCPECGGRVETEEAKVNVCKECGCTDNNACVGGCYWVNKEKTLCSQCDAKLKQKKRGTT